MIHITELQIAFWAPNPAAVTNGRAISRQGGFVRLERSADDTFYLGECVGSGSSHYIASVDFVDVDRPVFRCTCPSDQNPCKHALALLFEIAAEKSFAEREIPEPVLLLRAGRNAKAAGGRGNGAAVPAKASGKARGPRNNRAARAKKLQKQLEGLDLTERLVRDLVNAGLGAMGGTRLTAYRELSRQLGDYYLPGPQRLLNRLILEIETYQEDGHERHHRIAADVLERLWTLVKRSRKYLTDKLDSGEVGHDDNRLFEELGGVWRLPELEAQGLVKRDALVAQLAFWVAMDETRAEYVDTGCWADLSTGEVYYTFNYRPFRAVKYVKREDTVFGAVHVPLLMRYPGDGNCRVRWDGAESVPLTPDALGVLRARAAVDLAEEARFAKNYLKNTMSAPVLCRLVRFARIGRAGETVALQGVQGGAIVLGDAPELGPTVHRLGQLPDPELLEDQVLLGAFWYDDAERRLKLQPLSIVTGADVVRLLY